MKKKMEESNATNLAGTFIVKIGVPVILKERNEERRYYHKT